jgi:hypothetical protein
MRGKSADEVNAAPFGCFVERVGKFKCSCSAVTRKQARCRRNGDAFVRHGNAVFAAYAVARFNKAAGHRHDFVVYFATERFAAGCGAVVEIYRQRHGTNVQMLAVKHSDGT